MRFLDLIEAKKRGDALDDDQIRHAIDGYVAGSVPDYQMAALLMAIRWRGLDDRETRALTRSMVESGSRYRWGSGAGPAVDKHSTGGVGDKVSLVLAPLAAAAGCIVPMISGRGLGHTGGTLDKLESIPGFRTDLDAAEFEATINAHGLALGAQTDDLVPADRLLYALRDATGTVDDTGLITASILSKKIAEGAAALVLDVKVGSGAFFASAAEARSLATRLRDVASGSGLACSVLLTDMSQPLGQAVGNALEVREAMACLAGGGPADLREITLALGTEMLRLGGLDDDGRERLEELLDNGAARQKFLELVAAQGGDVAALTDGLREASQEEVVRFDRSGYVAEINTRDLGLAAIALRAGRDRREDLVDPAAGLLVAARLGDSVRDGDVWLTLHYNDGADVDRARRLVHAAVTITDDPPEVPPLIHELIQ